MFILWFNFILSSLRTADVSPRSSPLKDVSRRGGGGGFVSFLLVKRPSAAMSEEKRLPFAGYILSWNFIFVCFLIINCHAHKQRKPNLYQGKIALFSSNYTSKFYHQSLFWNCTFAKFFFFLKKWIPKALQLKIIPMYMCIRWNCEEFANKRCLVLNFARLTKVAFLLANLNPDFAIENSIFCSFKDQTNLRAVSICQNWPAGPLPDQSVSKWNLLFLKIFAEKPSPSCILFRIWLIWLNNFD